MPLEEGFNISISIEDFSGKIIVSQNTGRLGYYEMFNNFVNDIV